MIEALTVAIFFICVNILLSYKPIPIIGFPVGIFSIFIYITVVIHDSTIPFQPYFTMFALLIAGGQLLVDALEIRGN